MQSSSLVPKTITVELLNAKVANDGEPVFAIIALDGERFRTSHSDKLVWNEACTLTVSDVSSNLTIKLKSRNGSYGKFKAPVHKVPHARGDEPAHLPLEDSNKRPAGELVMHFYVSKWQQGGGEQDGMGSPGLSKYRVQELGSMTSVRQSGKRGRGSRTAAVVGQAVGSASTPMFNRHLSVEVTDSESGTESELSSSSRPESFRGKVMRRVRSLSASKRTQPHLFSASAPLEQPVPAYSPPAPESPSTTVMYVFALNFQVCCLV